jgi:hypothetical protein
MDGEIDEFIDAWLRQQAAEQLSREGNAQSAAP